MTTERCVLTFGAFLRMHPDKAPTGGAGAQCRDPHVLNSDFPRVDFSM